MRTPHLERTLNGGLQRLYRFLNGHGASVIFDRRGALELALLRFTSTEIDAFEVAHESSAPEGIVDGFAYDLDESGVDDLLARIEALAECLLCEGEGSHDCDDADGYASMCFCSCEIGQAAYEAHLDDLGIPKWARAS
jgi:hypothetical protein